MLDRLDTGKRGIDIGGSDGGDQQERDGCCDGRGTEEVGIDIRGCEATVRDRSTSESYFQACCPLPYRCVGGSPLTAATRPDRSPAGNIGLGGHNSHGMRAYARAEAGIGFGVLRRDALCEGRVNPAAAGHVCAIPRWCCNEDSITIRTPDWWREDGGERIHCYGEWVVRQYRQNSARGVL